MLTTFFIWLTSSLPLLHALAITSPSLPSKRCSNSNYLQNPSFESGLDPWFPIVSGSWEARGVYTSGEGGHAGSNFYYGHSNSTVDTTLTLSQSGFALPSAGSTIDCAAWFASHRPGNAGSTRIELFLDGQTCGSVVYLGTTGWTRVGGKVQVQAVDSHTFAMVIISYDAGPEGWTIWADDAVVGGC